MLGQLPETFVLKDLTSITGRIFELGKRNVHQLEAKTKAEDWFRRIGAYQGRHLDKFFSYRFDEFAAFTFPEASSGHLETCLAFFFWAFSFDDLSDEGELQSNPDGHKIGIDISRRVFEMDLETPPPTYPYAIMLHHLWATLNQSATPGTCHRFAMQTENWWNSQMQQSRNRMHDRVPTVEEFVIMRRNTIGVGMVEAMVEYSLDINLPDFVFDDPIIKAMSDATNDLTTWPNDLCSFNKEQADGDYQNLVVCAMLQHGLDLQQGIDFVTQMVADRVEEYVNLKKQLRSFGPVVDDELHRYLRGLEHLVQATVVWYYSPRYFRALDLSDRAELIVPVFT